MRRALVLSLILGCGPAAIPGRPVENRGVGPTPTPSGAPLAAALDGPYATLDEYCAHVKAASAEATCAGAGTATTPAPFEDIEVLQVSPPGATETGCVAMVAVDGSWYATPISHDVCFERGYIDTSDVATAPLDGSRGLAIHISAQWHTNDYSDEASYTLTALCGLVDGLPRCTPFFTSQCERQAPAGDCYAQGYAVTWTIAGDAITFTSSRALAPNDDDVKALLGAHRLGF